MVCRECRLATAKDRLAKVFIVIKMVTTHPLSKIYFKKYLTGFLGDKIEKTQLLCILAQQCA